LEAVFLHLIPEKAGVRGGLKLFPDPAFAEVTESTSG